MKINQVNSLPLFLMLFVLASCAEPNKPVQTASDYELNGGDSISAASVDTIADVDRDSAQNHHPSKKLPEQMVPENSSITISPELNKVK